MAEVVQVTATTMTPLRCYENNLKSSIFAGYFRIKKMKSFLYSI